MDDVLVTRIFLSLLIAGVAYAVSRRFRLLSADGAAAAAILAAVLFGCYDVRAFLPVVLFFLSSSVLSRIAERLAPDADGRFAKGSERDALQVVANGGVAAFCSILLAAGGGERWYAALLGATAAATADTWATEIGMMAGAPVRLLPSLRRVPRGTSGAVSIPGLAASIAGAVLIAAAALPFTRMAGTTMALAVITGGVVGALVDSLLGALVQERFRCARCGRETERATHCETPATRIGGWIGVSNDVVNFACTMAGALTSFGLVSALTPGILSA